MTTSRSAIADGVVTGRAMSASSGRVPAAIFGLLGSLAAMLIAAPAAAESRLSESLTTSGFATLGVTRSTASGIEYRRATNQDAGVSDGELSFAVDSRAGLQLSLAPRPAWRIVVQGLVEHDVDSHWSPQLSRATLSFRPVPALTLRAGRIGQETYAGTESRSVGYSYLTVRPPLEAFGTVARDYYDGADLTWTRMLGSVVAKAKGYCGQLTGGVVSRDGQYFDTDGASFCGTSFDLEWPSGLTAHLALARLIADDPVTDPALVDALRDVGSSDALRLAEALDGRPRRSDAIALSLLYEVGPTTALLYLTRYFAEAFPMAEGDQAVAVLGHRTGSLTPYVQLAYANSQSPRLPTGVPADAAYAPLSSAAAGIQIAAQFEQRTLSLGLRHDFAPGWALKAQIDHVWLAEPHLLLDTDPGGAVSRHTWVTTLAVDVVF